MALSNKLYPKHKESEPTKQNVKWDSSKRPITVIENHPPNDPPTDTFHPTHEVE